MATTGIPNVAVVSTLVFAVTAGTCWPWCLELGYPWQRAVEVGLGMVGLVVASWGLATLAGPGTLVVPAAITAVAPFTLPLWRRLVQRRPAARSTAADPPDPADVWERWRADDLADAVAEMRALPLPMLCQFWRDSGQRLQTASPHQSMWLVERRAVCLDEIERRRPDDLHRWLEGGQGRDLRDYLTNAGDSGTE